MPRPVIIVLNIIPFMQVGYHQNMLAAIELAAEKSLTFASSFLRSETTKNTSIVTKGYGIASINIVTDKVCSDKVARLHGSQ